MSNLAQLIAMMDPGVYEDRKQTLGDVGPWPGRMDDAYLTEKAEMDKLLPGLQYAMSGAAAGSALTGLLNGAIAPMSYTLKTTPLPHQGALGVDWLDAKGGVDFKRSLFDIVKQASGSWPKLSNIWTRPIDTNMEGGGRAMNSLVKHLPGVKTINEREGDYSRSIPVEVLEELLSSKRQQKQFFDAVRTEPKWNKK